MPGWAGRNNGDQGEDEVLLPQPPQTERHSKSRECQAEKRKRNTDTEETDTEKEPNDELEEKPRTVLTNSKSILVVKK